MFRRSALAVALLLTCASQLPAMEAPLPRHPAPSPDGRLIAFSWQGDIWLVPATGGAARRLTAHPAAERHPVWSRDGALLAFASDRFGNPDVFVMPADGSEPPTRLSFASVTDRPLDFTPDGSSLVFESNRAEGVRWMPQLWTVPITGGTPALAQSAFGSSAAYSLDGEAVAFVRGATRWFRRGYRGAANRELWLRTADDDYVRLTDFDGDDDYPSWIDGHTLVFQSARSGRKNVFLLDLITDEVVQLTHHEGSDVRFPRAAADGSLVAYEFEDALWTIISDGAAPTRLSIDVPADLVMNPVDRRTSRGDADELAVNPEGTLAAFVVHGDVFVTEITSEDDQKIAEPVTVRVTRSPEREQDIEWSPDGESLLYASARNGSNDLFLARPADDEAGWAGSFDFEESRLTDSPAEEAMARFSPDGERIAFVRGKGELVVIPAAGGEETVLLEHWDTLDYRWSPDGRWIAYSTDDIHYNAEVWIVAADGGRPYNLSRHPDNDTAPRWSPDGRRLVWQSKRHADTVDVWGVWLTRADHERTPAQWLKLWKEKEEPPKKEEEEADDKAEKKKKKKGEDEEKEEEKPELPEVSIDFEDLWRRAEAITDLKGDEGPALVSPDGKTVVFTAEHQDERDLYSVRWDGEDLERLTEGGQLPHQLQFSDDGKTLYYLNEGGAIKRIGLDGKDGDPIPFTARYEVDRAVERGVVLDEAWRALAEWFYDPDFHGVDWPAQRDKYRPWALEASHDADFADVMNLMIGEVNASHMGYYHRNGQGGDTTGWIGATFDPTAGGPGLLVREVLPDSPAARVDVGLEAGNRILAVNGSELDEGTNLYSLFVDTVDRRLPITIRGADGVERQAVVIPIGFEAHEQLRYEEWVRQRRRLAEEWSEGRLGYIHIQEMGMASFEEFERGLQAAAEGREGLIIDVRSNGGGWTTDYLMAVLMVQRHAFTVPRDADPDERAYPQSRLPLSAWTRPALTLCNEDSYSNAEIFAYAFQSLERGPLVGAPTFGAVISTGGTGLLNGAWVRLPLRGWFVAGSGLNMENNGAVPDVVVWQPPVEDSSTTVDSQLRTGVDVLLEGLENDPRHGAW